MRTTAKLSIPHPWAYAWISLLLCFFLCALMQHAVNLLPLACYAGRMGASAALKAQCCDISQSTKQCKISSAENKHGMRSTSECAKMPCCVTVSQHGL